MVTYKMQGWKATHVVLVCVNGDIDATLVATPADGVDYLRERAKGWNEDTQGNPAPFPYEVATFEELQDFIRLGHEGEEAEFWIDISPLTVPMWVQEVQC